MTGIFLELMTLLSIFITGMILGGALTEKVWKGEIPMDRGESVIRYFHKHRNGKWYKEYYSGDLLEITNTEVAKKLEEKLEEFKVFTLGYPEKDEKNYARLQALSSSNTIPREFLSAKRLSRRVS